MSSEQERELVAALGEAERGNRGEVRLHVDHRPPPDLMPRVQSLFSELGLQETEEQTGVLLYVSLASRQAAVWAGAGIHGSREPGFWQEVTDAVAAGFRDRQAVAGLRIALVRIGELLREVVPGEDPHGNEIPDEVSES